MNNKIYIFLLVAGILFNLSPIVYKASEEGRSPASFDSENSVHILEANPALVIH